MSLSVVYRPAAAREYEAAAVWYDQQEDGLGDQFIQEVERVLDFASGHPEMYPVQRGSLRRALVRRFPYAVLYRAGPEHLVVAAVVHLRQEPNQFGKR